MDKTKSLALLALLFLSWGSLHSAQTSLALSQARVTVTDHFLFSNGRDPLDSDSDTSLLLHEDVILAEYGLYSGSVRLNNRFVPNNDADTRPLTLEKKQLAADWETVELRLGDTNQELGRGIALSLYRDEAFGTDTTLEGVSTRFFPRGVPVEFAVMGGRLNSLRSPVAISPLENALETRTVWLAAAQMQIQTTSDSSLGLHYVLTLNEPNDKTGMGNGTFDRTWNTAGTTFELAELFPETDLYLETNALLIQRLRRGKYYFDPMGWGSYTSLTWSPSPWVVTLEAKDYRRFDYEFRRPPTLEVDLVETENETDVFATRLRVERLFLESNASIFSSLLVGDEREKQTGIYHGVVGGTFTLSNLGNLRTEANAGYRTLPNEEERIHTTWQFKLPTTKSQSLELTAAKEWLTKGKTLNPIEENRNKLEVAYNFSHQWTLGAGYEYVPTNLDLVGQHFGNMSVNYKTSQLTAKLFFGKTSGGTLCSGGVCRKRPAYNGGFLETVYRF